MEDNRANKPEGDSDTTQSPTDASPATSASEAGASLSPDPSPDPSPDRSGDPPAEGSDGSDGQPAPEAHTATDGSPDETDATDSAQNGSSADTADEPPSDDNRKSGQSRRGRGSQNKKTDRKKAKGQRSQSDPTRELLTLLELAIKYPEIGPSVASLAFKLGKSEIGERLVRLGQQGDTPNLEYYFVTAHTARREQRWNDVLDISATALNSFIETRGVPDRVADSSDATPGDDTAAEDHVATADKPADDAAEDTAAAADKPGEDTAEDTAAAADKPADDVAEDTTVAAADKPADAAAEDNAAAADKPEDNVVIDHDESTRLLHLLRLGFSTLMFELDNVKAAPGFIEALGSGLPKLEPFLGEDPFFRTLIAQTLWFEDRERSEAEWDRAAQGSDSDFAWNARGTWYKEAERDLVKAEKAYRKGLESAPRSSLLLHNVAQVLLDRADRSKDDPRTVNRLLNQAEELLRSALRESASKNRRHIHATRDRVSELRREFPRPRRPKHDGPQGRGPRNRRPDDGPRPGGNDRRGQRRNDSPDGGRDGGKRDDRGGGPRKDSNAGGGGSRGGDQGGDRNRGRGRRPRRQEGDNRGGDRRREGGAPRGRGDRRGPRDDRGDRRDSRSNDKSETPAKFNLGDMLAAKFKKEQDKKD